MVITLLTNFWLNFFCSFKLLTGLDKFSILICQFLSNANYSPKLSWTTFSARWTMVCNKCLFSGTKKCLKMFVQIYVSKEYLKIFAIQMYIEYLGEWICLSQLFKKVPAILAILEFLSTAKELVLFVLQSLHAQGRARSVCPVTL